MSMEPTAVYTIYDEAREPVYIGCSCEPTKRVRQHAVHPWFPEAPTVHLTWFPTRDQALAFEAARIETVRPANNVKSNPDTYKERGVRISAYVPPEIKRRLQAAAANSGRTMSFYCGQILEDALVAEAAA